MTTFLCIAIIFFLLIIYNKINNIMATQEQFQQALGRIDTATTGIAETLKSLRDQIGGAGLPPEVEDSVLSQLNAAADKLEGIGKTDAGTGTINTGDEGGAGTILHTEEPGV